MAFFPFDDASVGLAVGGAVVGLGVIDSITGLLVGLTVRDLVSMGRGVGLRVGVAVD